MHIVSYTGFKLSSVRKTFVIKTHGSEACGQETTKRMPN